MSAALTGGNEQEQRPRELFAPPLALGELCVTWVRVGKSRDAQSAADVSLGTCLQGPDPGNDWIRGNDPADDINVRLHPCADWGCSAGPEVSGGIRPVRRHRAANRRRCLATGGGSPPRPSGARPSGHDDGIVGVPQHRDEGGHQVDGEGEVGQQQREPCPYPARRAAASRGSSRSRSGSSRSASRSSPPRGRAITSMATSPAGAPQRFPEPGQARATAPQMDRRGSSHGGGRP